MDEKSTIESSTSTTKPGKSTQASGATTKVQQERAKRGESIEELQQDKKARKLMSIDSGEQGA